MMSLNINVSLMSFCSDILSIGQSRKTKSLTIIVLGLIYRFFSPFRSNNISYMKLSAPVFGVHILEVQYCLGELFLWWVWNDSPYLVSLVLWAITNFYLEISKWILLFPLPLFYISYRVSLSIYKTSTNDIYLSFKTFQWFFKTLQLYANFTAMVIHAVCILFPHTSQFYNYHSFLCSRYY